MRPFLSSFCFLAGFLLCPLCPASDVIPSTRRADLLVGDTNGYGVPGGIWQYRGRTVVNATGLTDTSGGTDYSATIKAQLDALSPGQCLLLPAGTFKVYGGLNVGVRADGTAGTPNITLRGAGMGQTILMLYGDGGVGVSGGGGFPTDYPSALYLSQDTPAGSTTITCDATIDSAAGLNILIDGAYDSSLPTVSVGGYSNLRPVLLRQTGGSGNTATFWPPLPFALKAGSRFTREIGTGSPHYVTSVQGLGLEDITVDGANSISQVIVGLYSTRQSWLYNVEAKNVNNYGINATFNLQGTIRHCKVHDQKITGSYTSRNLILMAASTLMHVEDNIIYNGYSAFELNAGVTLSAFSHNFTDRIALGEFGALGSDFNINHGPHNSFNVYEGNIAARIQSDGYFGSSSDETFHRNWFHGTLGVYTTSWDVANPVTGNRIPIVVNRFVRNFNIVGNQIGRTGLGITWAYANAGVGFDTTSTSSVSIGSGNKNFTFATGLSYNNNGTIALAYSAGDSTKWLLGRVWDYNASNGTCYIAVERTNGSGTFSDWIIKGGGGYGSDTLYAFGGPNIGNGGFFGALTICAPQSLGIWWRCWDGAKFNRRGDYNSGTAYNMTGSGTSGTADVVNYYVAAGPYSLTGGEGISQWVAANPAKSGAATWTTPGADGDWLPISNNSFQELDYDSYSTAIIKDNWNAATGGVHSTEALGSDTYPVSRIRSGSTRPAFFGSSLTYPAFDSHSPNQSFEAIPAGYRYVNNAEVPGYDPNDSLTSTAAPVFSPSAGTYASAQSVTITSSTSGATIYYTTNGTTPTTSSTVYSGALTISATTTLKALAVKSGLDDSSVTSGTYTIGGGAATTLTTGTINATTVNATTATKL